ncbi:MAG TPA: sulfur carrier protein ThiS adenylyltransferase ThiF [Anaerohalosphaeraceae bacterium]|jgi:sulfur carrier protein ThiS adenylyltransferase|nr:sulfur carrier protein ThiS adenylyltransferase ThiF [Anaerohalosphaeraceae bacterium]HOT73588.1 sulfur carrier protein ThiS adenylyltransferase ThiF [Anaerohalosphaeraceae bacterium]HPB93490.1 sulfur carrier protein ThiS adenylyltransferase ThiF [Anaerohalosphaeraceae bacterium]HQG06694.1 sulfur carrier protein ThiS adenylyltransferase ThiF [Anaerohalosphaeraceae bacterium]HQI08235.1 sulfur carrier protein ThiS adenylyltransferase ThiF [Anaerohalosphaeraceae bacterium]
MTPPVFFELKSAVVGIAGLGGLGSHVAEALVRMNTGKLILVDYDHVEAGNLNRQNYFYDQIGRFKVDATIENLRRIWPEANLEGHKVRLTPENIQTIFAEADVIAECLDRVEQKQMIVETVLSKMPDKVIVSVSGLAGWGASNDIVTRRISPRLVLVGDGISGIGPGIPLTASRVGVAAYHQANAVVEVLREVKRIPSPGGWQ